MEIELSSFILLRCGLSGGEYVLSLTSRLPANQ